MYTEMEKAVGLNKIDVYFETHVEEIWGECFDYNIYFEDELTDAKFNEVNVALDKFHEQYNDRRDFDLGDIWLDRDDDKIIVNLDLGCSNTDFALLGILNAINVVPGIKKVIINECNEDNACGEF